LKVSPSIIKHEFIGLNAEITKSRNPSYLGIRGTIVDETRHTFKISHNGKVKTLVKDQAVFSLTFSDSTVIEAAGENLRGRPSQRLKRRVGRRW
jgi:ribonuclease P protein subunit POP4